MNRKNKPRYRPSSGCLIFGVVFIAFFAVIFYRPFSILISSFRTLHPDFAYLSRQVPLIKFPKNAKILGSELSSGFQDRWLYLKIEIDKKDVDKFVASLPKPIELSRTESQVPSTTGGPSWWDPGSPHKFIYATVPEPYGRSSRFPMRLLIKMDNHRHAIIYVEWMVTGWF